MINLQLMGHDTKYLSYILWSVLSFKSLMNKSYQNYNHFND